MNLSLSFYAISYSMKRLLALFALALALGWAGTGTAQVHYGPNARPPLGVVGVPGTGPVRGPGVVHPDPVVTLQPAPLPGESSRRDESRQGVPI